MARIVRQSAGQRGAKVASRWNEIYYLTYGFHQIHELSTMPDTLTVQISAEGLPRELRSEVIKILQEMAPLVANQIERKRHDNVRRVIDALTEGVAPRQVDLRQARMQANAIQVVLKGAEWLTAAEIGKLGGFSQSNPAAPANRWKNEGKIFAVEHGGQDHFPRYALDENFPAARDRGAGVGHAGKNQSLADRRLV